MLGLKSRSWFYPKPTGDPGRDRNARTLQFSCFLLAFAVGAVLIVSTIGREWQETPLLVSAITGMVAAAVMNRAGRSDWAGRTAYLVVLLSAILLVFQAHDGFRSHSMLVFPGLLLISVMMLDRASYVMTAGIVVVAVAAVGIAVKLGLTRATPPVRTTYDSIFYVDLNLLVIAIVGSRIARDTQSNVLDLRAGIDRLSAANLELTETGEALRRSERMLATELDAAQRLQNFATQLISTQETRALYEKILDTVVAILHTDFASIQMFCPDRGTDGELRLLGHRGFSTEAAKRWEWVGRTTRTSCGEALRTGRRVAVRDVRDCDFMSGSNDLEEYLDAGIRAGQTSPLVSRSGVLMGMFSTYWREPHELSAAELGALDVLARMSADLIERSQRWEKLRESEERFRRMFEEGPLGLGLVGKNYRFIKVNNTLCQMVGYSEAELLQKSFVDITHPDDLQADVELAQQLFRGERPFYKMQKRYVKKNGAVIWINLTGSVIRDKEGEPLYGLAMIEDITEVKRAQEEALARQKLESVGVLAGGIAHDFNNLLGGVLAQAELALEELDAGSVPKEELQGIREVAIRGSEIVRQLMIYAGKEDEIVGLANISQIVKEMIQLLNLSVSKHVTLEFDLGNDLPAVRGNAGQLRQIVLNLVTNASEAMGDRGGVIRLTARHAAAISRKSVENDCLELDVSDNGLGMSQELQARVFDPFFTTKSAGRGLGLSVVHGIVRGLRGSIHLTSEPGKGTTFKVCLPCEDKAGATGDWIADSEQPARPSHTFTVLVVEDEDPLRQAVCKMLRQKGFEVLEAANGTAAVDLLHESGGKIDVMLLDMTIPGASSHEVFAEAAKARSDIKVFLTSAYSQEMLTPPLSAAQIRGFIRKPFQLGDLVRTLQNAFAYQFPVTPI